MPMRLVALVAVVLFTAAAPSAARAKGYSRVVLVGADGRSTQIQSKDRELDAWVDWSAKPRRAAGGYVRLFFLGPGDFPANPARYYPHGRCVALDWPTYEAACHPLQHVVTSLFRRSPQLARFAAPPTIPARITYLGNLTGVLKTAAALAGPLELALDRKGHRQPTPGSCYAFTASGAGRPRRCARDDFSSVRTAFTPAASFTRCVAASGPGST